MDGELDANEIKATTATIGALKAKKPSKSPNALYGYCLKQCGELTKHASGVCEPCRRANKMKIQIKRASKGRKNRESF